MVDKFNYDPIKIIQLPSPSTPYHPPSAPSHPPSGDNDRSLKSFRQSQIFHIGFLTAIWLSQVSQSKMTFTNHNRGKYLISCPGPTV